MANVDQIYADARMTAAITDVEWAFREFLGTRSADALWERMNTMERIFGERAMDPSNPDAALYEQLLALWSDSLMEGRM